MAARPSWSRIRSRDAPRSQALRACLPLAGGSRAIAEGAEPTFSKGGSNAELYGAADNYPAPKLWPTLVEQSG
jgi:hypothetical protein